MITKSIYPAISFRISAPYKNSNYLSSPINFLPQVRRNSTSKDRSASASASIRRSVSSSSSSPFRSAAPSASGYGYGRSRAVDSAGRGRGRDSSIAGKRMPGSSSLDETADNISRIIANTMSKIGISYDDIGPIDEPSSVHPYSAVHPSSETSTSVPSSSSFRGDGGSRGRGLIRYCRLPFYLHPTFFFFFFCYHLFYLLLNIPSINL